MAQARLLARLGDATAAEKTARGALDEFRAAMNWLEDTPEFEVAHFRIDEAGRWIRSTFGCWLTRRGSSYSYTCPADLAHDRFGFSPGLGDVIRECNVCGLDPRLCRHITGRTYAAPRRIVAGRCNLCGAESCGHKDGEIGDAPCFHIIVSIGKADEISIVARPVDPMARATEWPVSVKEIAANLGPRGWVPGMDVSCDRCLRVCLGVHEIDLGQMARARSAEGEGEP